MRRHFYYSIEFDPAGNIISSRLRPDDVPIERFIAAALEEGGIHDTKSHTFQDIRTYDINSGRLMSTDR